MTDDVTITRVSRSGPRMGERTETPAVFIGAAEVEAAWDRALYRIPVADRPKPRHCTPAYHLWMQQRARRTA